MTVEGRENAAEPDPPAVALPGASGAAAAPAGAGLDFRPTRLPGAWLVEPKPSRDHRGFFARTFCARAFAERGLVTHFVQHSTSHSSAKGTLRGMHFQLPPHGEVKVVSCMKGAIWDVIIDLRPGSATFRQWQSFFLTAGNRRRLYVPEGFAHGFQTLAPESEVGYLISAYYRPEASAGVRYDDPCFAISWPLPPAALSERDRTWPDFPAAG